MLNACIVIPHQPQISGIRYMYPILPTLMFSFMYSQYLNCVHMENISWLPHQEFHICCGNNKEEAVTDSSRSPSVPAKVKCIMDV